MYTPVYKLFIGGLTMELNEFRDWLKQSNLSENTIKSYSKSVEQFFSQYEKITKKNLLSFKGYLLERYKPKTVNLRLQAINRYLEYIGKDNYRMKFVKVQQQNFLENVISDADYRFFIKKLKADKRMNWYFIVRYLCATGARISELVQIKIEDVEVGYLDIYGKGGKMRRLYIPKRLRNETIKWLNEMNYTSGYLFLNRFGERITTRGIAHQLKVFATDYGINPDVVYPHSFRHRFAKNFLDKYNDLALLADLMGHESIETTRIYLRRTANEQQELIDRIVTW